MIRGKRFLITQPMIHGLNGSTMVALEMAEYLRSEGGEVTVYTYYYDDPARYFFEERKIRVLIANDQPALLLTDFDYVWVHSQVLPISIVRELGRELPKKIPIFIFHHMSPFDWLPDERPYIFDLEKKLAAKTLFVSIATKEEQKDYFDPHFDFDLFRNPAPKAFSEMKHKPRRKLKKILIVSNHPPQELLEAKELLKVKGIEVVSFGEKSEEYGLITPKLIAGFDVVVTIGKTVQYCLVAGIPVYVYDHFGGKGYIDDNNNTSAPRNFSGRDGKRQTAEYLAEDITRRYEATIEYQLKNRKKFIDEFSINKVFPNIIKTIKQRKIERFDIRYMNAVISAQIFAKNRFEAGTQGWNHYKENQDLKKQIDELSLTLGNCSEENADLEKKLDESNEQLRLIQSSKAFRLRMLLAKPLLTIKSKVHRHFDR